MRRRSCRREWLLAVLLLLGAGPVTAPAQEVELRGMALVDALRQGGYNLYFRHAATDWNQPDRVEREGDWRSCDPERLRQLSAAGRRAARSVGAAMRELAIPIGRIFASPYCRTLQTAEEMDLGPVEPTTDVMNLRVADYFGGRERILDAARRRLASAPAAGRNNVYVAHGNVAMSATRVYPEEGEALVFRPLGGDAFAFVGRLTPARWRDLAGTAE